jgi:SAM-dependent methyltransferase
VSDPNSDEALEVRQQALDRVRSVSVASKDEYLLALCRDREVLDLGCVGHAVRVDDPQWLHGRIRGTARRLVGVDIDESGVQALRARGFDVRCVDVSDPPPAELVDAPFDVVVASEIIEHMSSPQHLMSFARHVLKPDGVLVVTSPNPFAPSRVALGRRRTSLENVDHVVLAFPGGIVEMAQRSGLELLEAGTTALPSNWTLVKRAVRSREMVIRGGTRPYWYFPFTHLLSVVLERKWGWCGETAVYLLRKPTSAD